MEYRNPYTSRAEHSEKQKKGTHPPMENHDERRNDEAMHLQLNLVDEVRATAEQRLAWYQDLMAKNYNSKVRWRDFQVGDLVLRKVMGTVKDTSQGKLGPNWERAYRIAS